jgi:hypothetical protein
MLTDLIQANQQYSHKRSFSFQFKFKFLSTTTTITKTKAFLLNPFSQLCMGKMFMSFCLHKNLLPVIIREKANLLIKHQHQPFGEKVLEVHSNIPR